MRLPLEAMGFAPSTRKKAVRSTSGTGSSSWWPNISSAASICGSWSTEVAEKRERPPSALERSGMPRMAPWPWTVGLPAYSPTAFRPWVRWMAVMRSAASASASSQDRGSHRSPTRRIGSRMRSGWLITSGMAAALGQTWPRLNGSSRSPRTPVTRPPSS